MGDELRSQSRIFDMFILTGNRIDRELHALKRLELKICLKFRIFRIFWQNTC